MKDIYNSFNEYVLERKTFQEMITHLVETTCKQIKEIVGNAGLKMSEIDRVLLAGGSTRIPYIEEMVKQVTGKPVYRDADPELVSCFAGSDLCKRVLDYHCSNFNYP